MDERGKYSLNDDHFFAKYLNLIFSGYKQKIMITYAPFQNIPNLEKKRENKREGTIEKGFFCLFFFSFLNTQHRLEDEEFLAFVAKLNEPKETLPSAEIQLEKRLAEESKLAGMFFFQFVSEKNF